MNFRLAGAALLLTLALTGCGGGGSGSGGNSIIPVSAAQTGATITGVTVASPPVVTFVVKDSAGNPVTGLKLYDAADTSACKGANVTFAIAKFDGDNWQNLISRQRYVADDLSNPAAPKYAVIEGTTDPKPTATLTNTDPTHPVVGSLEESSGVYTYRFAIDVTTPLLMANAVDQRNVSLGRVANNGNLAVKDGATLHRVALQLCYVDPLTQQAVKVNPYVDFTLDGAGKGVINTDTHGVPSALRKVVDRASCNECHQNLALHGGGRIDPNYCVMCHNPGSRDYATGNLIDLKLMVHKFHMGRRLTQDYAVQSAVARKNTGGMITGMLYPQDQRNCVKCHDGSATAVHPTAQGDNWQGKASKNACWACHDDYKTPGSKWQLAHASYSAFISPSIANPDATPDIYCRSCHTQGGTLAPPVAKSHAITELGLSANYQLNIHGITRNANNTLTVEYSVSNPATSSTYDIQSSQYSYITGATTTKTFAGLNLLFAWGDYSNGGQARGQPISVNALSGTKLGSGNHYSLTSSVLPATGTVTVAFVGNVNPPDSLGASLTVPVANVTQNYAMSGIVQARRQVVSAAKCNACHGQNVGYTDITTATPSLSGHGGSTDPQTCAICHNGNLDATTSNLVAHNADSGDFKRMIHKVHKAQGTNYPVMPSAALTALTSTSRLMPGAMVGTYTGIMNCTVCHEGTTYLTSSSVLGSSTSVNGVDALDPTQNGVISPKAAACSSCHTDAAGTAMRDHMIQGGAVFGTVTQANVGTVFEQCDGCHLPGAVMAVDKAHGLTN